MPASLSTGSKPEHPFISVVLPVYNGSAYLRESIDCILSQTYTNFEFIIIDDGSSDDSTSIIKSYDDSRIIFHSQKNQGLAATLNRGMELAEGIYIARQDHDDLSMPKRFEKQVEFMENHPDCGMTGTWSSILDVNTPTDRSHRHPYDNLDLQFELLFDNPFVHSSVMIRRSVFDTVDGYCTDPGRQPPEDYELWSRIAREFKIANLPEILHIYREIPGSMSRTGDSPFLNHLLNINVENLSAATCGRYAEIIVHDLAALAHGIYYKYSGRTSLKELLAVVRSAADNLCRKYGRNTSYLNDRVSSRARSLRYHYYRSKYSGFFNCIENNRIFRIIQKLK